MGAFVDLERAGDAVIIENFVQLALSGW